MARLVLVHGAFGGPWFWEPITGDLEEAGHTVELVTLPGSGEDQTPLAQVSLDAYAERICDVLASHPEPAVLVGHSMGGVAITQAAGHCPGRISLLIYVAAFLPREGQSLIDLTQLPEAAGDLVQANMVVEGDPPVATLRPSAARDALFGKCNDEQVAWGIERLGAQAVVPFASPVTISDPTAENVPRAYVMCRHDHAVRPALQERMIRESPCVETVELDADHCPSLSAASELVGALDRLAGLASVS